MRPSHFAWASSMVEYVWPVLSLSAKKVNAQRWKPGGCIGAGG